MADDCLPKTILCYDACAAFLAWPETTFYALAAHARTSPVMSPRLESAASEGDFPLLLPGTPQSPFLVVTFARLDDPYLEPHPQSFCGL